MAVLRHQDFKIELLSDQRLGSYSTHSIIWVFAKRIPALGQVPRQYMYVIIRYDYNWTQTKAFHIRSTQSLAKWIIRPKFLWQASPAWSSFISFLWNRRKQKKMCCSKFRLKKNWPTQFLRHASIFSLQPRLRREQSSLDRGWIHFVATKKLLFASFGDRFGWVEFEVFWFLNYSMLPLLGACKLF